MIGLKAVALIAALQETAAAQAGSPGLAASDVPALRPKTLH
jgi:hypothetical protein